MKKITHKLRSKIHSLSRFYWLLFLPFILWSCYGTRQELQASIEGTRQGSSGPSYDAGEEFNDLDFGYNVAVIFMTSPGKNFISSLGKKGIGPDTPKSSTIESPGNLYASLSSDPSLLYYNSQNVSSETLKTVDDNSSSGFMSHVLYSGGLEYIQKNSKDTNTKIHLSYLEVPLYALYQTTETPKGNFFGGLGPYFAYGIGGNVKSTYGGQTTKTKSFDKNYGFKPFDAGLGITAGYKLPEGFSFSLAYEFGFTNLERNAGGDKTKNSGICLNVRYPLDKLLKK